MLKPVRPAPAIPDVYLPPGGLYASGPPCRIGTLLGSCVSVTLWAPRLGVGGMNHYLLPRQTGGGEASPRHGDTALEMLLARVETLGAHRRELEARILGGATVLGMSTGMGPSLGDQNVAAAWLFLRTHRIRVVDEQVGGRAARRITLDVDDGDLTMALVGGG